MRPEINRRVQQHEHAMGPIRRAILPRRGMQLLSKIRYIEILAFSRLFQQMEVWTNIGDQNERHINATYVKALRAVAGMTHTTASEARFTDMQ
eukprot:1772660-Pyramimonas_sp.AAC.1